MIKASVIIPVYNGEKFVENAIQSVQDQTLTPDEIIIVDDGSTDQTAQVLTRISHRSPIPVRLAYQENRGPAAARNHGLQLAVGEFICFLDADDLWPPDRIMDHLKIFSSIPETEMVVGTTRMSHFSPPPYGVDIPLIPVPMIQHQLGAITCRRQVFDRIGYFNPALLRGEDSEWLDRIMRDGVTLRLTRNVAVEYRIREGSLTYGTLDNIHWLIIALRNHLRNNAGNDAGQG